MTNPDDDTSAAERFKTGGGLELLAAASRELDSFIGQQFAHYRIRSLIAEGGMGRVYLGERKDGQFERKAAVKILPSGVGEEYVRRFERERAILAGLNHPNIAQLYDAGVAETGNLYLVMELVDGIPIDNYCRSRQATHTEKISLLIELCSALGFAHGRLVLHRDIKPSNVLVTASGTVKLLDFGIAKMIESQDSDTLGPSPMTPRFASPEQLLGEPASMASDIYQVGILMHLLLLDRTPFEELDLPARIRQVSEGRPFNLDASTSRMLPRELRTVLTHCLCTEPAQRYRDINSLAADLERYLNGFPVLIRPPGWTSVLGKWLKRNKLVSITASALTAALVGTTIWYTWSLQVSRADAQREALVASQSRDLVVDLLKAVDPLVAQGKNTQVIEVIDAGLASIRDAEIDDPEARVQLMSTLADVYHNLGAAQQAADLIGEAYEFSSQTLGPDHDMTLNSANLLASTQLSTGNFERAEELYDELMAALDRTGSHGALKAAVLNGRALMFLRTSRYPEAVEAGEAAVAYAQEQLGERSESALISISTLAEIYNVSDHPDKAMELLTAYKPAADQVLGELHQSAIGMTLNLAGANYRRFGLDQAAPLLEYVRNRNLQVFGADHPDTIRDTIFLGALYGEAGRFEESKTLIEEGIARHIKLFGPEHPNSVRYRSSLMHLYLQSGNLGSALEMCAELLPLHRKVNGKDHWFTLEARRSCARARYESGQQQEGSAELRSVLADMRRIFGDDFSSAEALANFMAENGIAEHGADAGQPENL